LGIVGVHPGSFSKSVKRKSLEHTELGRMYGKLEEGKWKSENGKWGTHPRATMQMHEKKKVAGGASWKLLKTKVQICREARKDWTVRNGRKS
jgi:hypothetical protein